MGDIQKLVVEKATAVYRLTDEKLEVYSVRVPRAHRKRGHATALMEELLQMADARGLPVALSASPLDRATRTDRLVAFYRKFGFEPDGTFANPAGDPNMVRPARTVAETITGDCSDAQSCGHRPRLLP